MDVDPHAVYHRAQQIDEIPGEAYSGTSVLAGAKAVQELGHLVEYRWATDVEDVLASLSVYGPVVIGVNWYEGMENTDVTGFIRPEGAVRGGHCVCLRGVVPMASDPYGWAALGRNSWSASWGIGGDFKLGGADLGKLMLAQGEVCVPVTRAPAPIVVTTTTQEETPMTDQQPGETAQDSQQTPEQDSGLQTPQPDQPVPTPPAEGTDGVDGSQDQGGLQPQPPEAEREALRQQADNEPTYPTNQELQAQEDQRQADLDAARQAHNERTGGGDVAPGELQAQRDEHNARTAGETTQDQS